MSASNRQMLNSGMYKEWEEKLRTATNLISEVIAEIYNGIGEDGQYDNASDDGALAEKLGLAKRFITEELPAKST